MGVMVPQKYQYIIGDENLKQQQILWKYTFKQQNMV